LNKERLGLVKLAVLLTLFGLKGDTASFLSLQMGVIIRLLLKRESEVNEDISKVVADDTFIRFDDGFMFLLNLF
jgi:hypothetical protein